MLRPEAAGPAPIERTVTGRLHWPPVMKRNLGSSSIIASPAVGRKSENMISTIGRRPVTDIPIAIPTNVFSQMGVFLTRPGNRSGRPPLVLKTPPSWATSSPSR